MTFAGIFDSEAEFDAFFAELYAEAGLTVCEVPKKDNTTTQQTDVVLCCVSEVADAD